jgi:hypothetical protein
VKALQARKLARNPAPGASLLHPFTWLSLVVLVLNDHVLKQLYPGVLSGKLSDFAGVLLLPVFVHALLELAAARLWHKPLTVIQGDRALAYVVGVCVLGFALPEVWQPAEVVYRYGLGAAQYPFRIVAAMLAGHGLPALLPVRATADVTDLLAMPMALVAFAVAKRGAGKRGAASAPQASAVSHST